MCCNNINCINNNNFGGFGGLDAPLAGTGFGSFDSFGLSDGYNKRVLSDEEIKNKSEKYSKMSKKLGDSYTVGEVHSVRLDIRNNTALVRVEEYVSNKQETLIKTHNCTIICENKVELAMAAEHFVWSESIVAFDKNSHEITDSLWPNF